MGHTRLSRSAWSGSVLFFSVPSWQSSSLTTPMHSAVHTEAEGGERRVPALATMGTPATSSVATVVGADLALPNAYRAPAGRGGLCTGMVLHPGSQFKRWTRKWTSRILLKLYEVYHLQ